MKFVHAANINLGRKEPGDEMMNINRTAEYMHDLQKVISACSEEHADVLFITGNLFNHAPQALELDEVDDRFCTIKDTKIFILPGKCDGPADSEYIYKYKWSANVTMLGGDCIQRVYLPGADCEVTGVGYNEATWSKVTVNNITPGNKGAIQILLLPFKEEDTVMPAGFDYVGMGNDELFMGDQERRYFSPGKLEPTGFSGQMRHGFLTGEIRKPRREASEISVHFRPAASREYMIIQVNASDDVTYEAVEEMVKNAISIRGEENFYQIIIRGRASASLYFGKDRLYRLGNILKIEDEASYEESIEHIRDVHAEDAVGHFIADIESVEDEEIRKKALKYGMDALLETQEEA